MPPHPARGRSAAPAAGPRPRCTWPPSGGLQRDGSGEARCSQAVRQQASNWGLSERSRPGSRALGPHQGSGAHSSCPSRARSRSASSWGGSRCTQLKGRLLEGWRGANPSSGRACSAWSSSMKAQPPRRGIGSAWRLTALASASFSQSNLCSTGDRQIHAQASMLQLLFPSPWLLTARASASHARWSRSRTPCRCPGQTRRTARPP